MKQLKMKQKYQKGFLPMLLRTLAASILRSILTGRGVLTASEGTVWKRQKF